jgi:DNA-binding HxlR family transcriptional regulator/GNAT superfamily N-acetyltransferase
MRITKEVPGLPIERTLGIISGRWKSIIIYVLLDGPKRICELESQVPGISQKVLIEQLRVLEEHGLVYRKSHAEEPLRVDYTLTPLGMSLEPLFRLLYEWGQHHAEELNETARLLPCEAVVRNPGSEVRRVAVESVEEYAAVWKELISEQRFAESIDEPGVSVRWAEHAFPFWDAIFLTEPTDDLNLLSEHLRRATAYMRSRKCPGFIYVCEEYIENISSACLSDILEDAKLSKALSLVGMAGDIIPFAAKPVPAGLELRRATTEQALTDLADVNCQAYGFPREIAPTVLTPKWGTELFSVVGYEKGHAVSAAAVFPRGTSLYLALVAVVPDARRKGFADATIRKAFALAYEATGIQRTILHATEAGFPVYQRLGYHKTATFHILT